MCTVFGKGGRKRFADFPFLLLCLARGSPRKFSEGGEKTSPTIAVVVYKSMQIGKDKFYYNRALFNRPLIQAKGCFICLIYLQAAIACVLSLALFSLTSLYSHCECEMHLVSSISPPPSPEKKGVEEAKSRPYWSSCAKLENTSVSLRMYVL